MNKNKTTKTDMVDKIYKDSQGQLERQKILEIMDLLLVEIKGSLEKGETIELRGFGTFEPRLRKGRLVARNPKTGEKVSVDPHYVAVFRAGQSLKENLWNLKVQETTDSK